jgi:hypothetical protein
LIELGIDLYSRWKEYRFPDLALINTFCLVLNRSNLGDTYNVKLSRKFISVIFPGLLKG